MAIPVNKPSIKRRDMDAVLTCLVSDSLGPGTLCRNLVSDLAGYLDLAGGIAIRDYHRAVAIALDSLSVGPESTVLLSPLAPDVYYQVLSRRGIRMVFPDVDPASGCISPESLASLDDVAFDVAVIETSLGYSPDLPALKRPGLSIIEDITAGLGGHNGRERNGRLGDCVIVGLEPEGIITAGGGAVVLAGNRKVHTALRGLSADLGEELLLPDMNSALGITQVKEVESFLTRRREIAQAFAQAMMRSRHKTLVQPGDGENVFYSFPVVLRSGLKDVATYARKNGVETRTAFGGSILAHHGEIADSGEGASPLTNAQGLLLRCILFPLYPTLTKKDRELIAKVLSTLP